MITDFFIKFIPYLFELVLSSLDNIAWASIPSELASGMITVYGLFADLNSILPVEELFWGIAFYIGIEVGFAILNVVIYAVKVARGHG